VLTSQGSVLQGSVSRGFSCGSQRLGGMISFDETDRHRMFRVLRHKNHRDRFNKTLRFGRKLFGNIFVLKFKTNLHPKATL
jgi:hypothetical protein